MKTIEEKDSRIIIEPELQIGTEFWIMDNNRPKLGLIAECKVIITSCTEKRSWHQQLFERWLNKTQKDIWKYSYYFTAKLDSDYYTYSVEKRNNGWYISGRPIYFSLEELKANL